MSKARVIIGWILVGLVAALMVATGIQKIVGGEGAQMYVDLGVGEFLVLIGIGEVVTAILFALPVTAPLGLLLASSYWGGAIATHMIDGSPFITNAMLLVIVWVSAYLLRPHIFTGLLPQPKTADS